MKWSRDGLPKCLHVSSTNDCHYGRQMQFCMYLEIMWYSTMFFICLTQIIHSDFTRHVSFQGKQENCDPVKCNSLRDWSTFQVKGLSSYIISHNRVLKHVIIYLFFLLMKEHCLTTNWALNIGRESVVIFKNYSNISMAIAYDDILLPT